ncbi:MAG: carbohydrate-binding domain-containing protein [Clostridia bacterium]|nr:carbohydrate-binding domain-containing protein [Clostridia bacterium]
MKKGIAILSAAALALALAACGARDGEASAVDTTVSADKVTGAFSLQTGDGAVERADGVYTITSAGTYTAKGLLDGRIVVDAGENDEVVLQLAGATVTCGQGAPIEVRTAGKTEISAVRGTENVIEDTRTVQIAAQTEGAISAACDLKIKGHGILVVDGGAGSGIVTTKDLVIQNLSLKVVARGAAICGGDSVTVTGGRLVAASKTGDGVKTENTDLNKSGKVRGDVLLSGGEITVYAAGDGFSAAHDFEMTAQADGGAPTVTVYTGACSGYTASDVTTTSYKGVKAQNEVRVADGEITLFCDDDGLHADSGKIFAAGGVGKGDILLSGGKVVMCVSTPENKTAAEHKSAAAAQTAYGADAVHADGVLEISGGRVTIESAYEGLEANVIRILGGRTTIRAGDDGVNACKGAEAPRVEICGGYLDVEVSPTKDTDGIDTNGDYVQSGGVVITRGPSGAAAAALDADGDVTVSGGTLIVLGGATLPKGDLPSYALDLHTEGTHTVEIGGVSYTFTNSETYGGTACYSDQPVTSR